MEPVRSFGDRHGHGHKRPAEDEVETQSGISTHFKKLRINHAPLQGQYRQHGNPRPTPEADYMPIDETKDRIVIHDLEAEIAQIEADEPKTMFLPDIDKKVSAIPQKLLQDCASNSQTQLVLYHEPASISVPEEQDAVRKAIIAARTRLREQQAKEREHAAHNVFSEYQDRPASNNMLHRLDEEVDDPDAMDLG